jgi:hypothetical protein
MVAVLSTAVVIEKLETALLATNVSCDVVNEGVQVSPDCIH